MISILFVKTTVEQFNSRMKVPLAYGPRQKYLVRLADDPDLSKSDGTVTLPRIGFEIAGMSYDPSRKLQRVQKFKKVKGANKSVRYTVYACAVQHRL